MVILTYEVTMDSFSRIVFCTVLLFQHTCSLENCSNSLGMRTRNKIIPDESITSSSYLRSDRAPSYARLDGPRAWCSAPRDNSPYIQILLEEEKLITAIETQGSRYDSIWSTRYDVWYLKRGNWTLHREGLPGNKNTRKIQRNKLSSPIRTHSIRIYPKDPFAVYTAPKFPCLRLELYGCTAPASCPDPGIPYQGKRIDQDFRHGHTVRFTCPRDYVIEGAAAIKCTDGRWNNTKPSCKAPCAEPTDPKHGLKMDRDFRHGRSVRFYCYSGYQRVGVASITCNDGKWDGLVPECKGVCGRPRTSSRVQLHGSGYLHGDEVTFSCHRSYDLFGKAKLRCMDQAWDSIAPECKARCTLLDPPEHGFYMKGFSNKDDEIKHGEKIRYGCNATYTLVGNSTQECNDGRWTNSTPSCKASCLPPAGIKHGIHIGNDYGHGKTVRFQCDREYILEGKDRVTCTDGKWDSDPPNCKDINECSTNSHSCDVNAVCGNTLGSYTCACKPGYWGNGRTCSDINECSTKSHSCNVNAVCGNTLGSYTCACKPGYWGNGRTCSDIDECSTNSHMCDVNAVCSNTVGSYACACKAGFTGDGNTCTENPIHGGFSQWSYWGHCSRSCGGGIRYRYRYCNNPRPQNGGRDCSEPATESGRCNMHTCPVDGRYSGWGAWSRCSVTCGVGNKRRSRSCTNPAPAHGGRDCRGSSSQSTRCIFPSCPPAKGLSRVNLTGIPFCKNNPFPRPNPDGSPLCHPNELLFELKILEEHSTGWKVCRFSVQLKSIVCDNWNYKNVSCYRLRCP